MPVFTPAARRLFGVLLALLLMATPVSLVTGAAADLDDGPTTRIATQNVDWLSATDAARLDLGFNVLVPSWIPGPFGGSPAIQGGGGYYSLYWMIPGGDPTFLLVEGTVGGALPSGSPADLNNQLSINASVQGYDAIHDVTSIYDNVWWIAGGVMYSVSSNNMTGTDSLSLANSLVALQQPAAPEPEPTETEVPQEPEPDTGSTGPTGSIDSPGSVASGSPSTVWAYPSAVGTLRTTGGYFVDSGQTFITDLTGGAVAWQAPSVDSETVVEFTLLDAQTGVVTDVASVVVYPVTGGGSTGANQESTGDAPDSAVTTEPTEVDEDSTASTDSDGTDAAGTSEDDTGAQSEASDRPLTDGTGGARLPSEGDGTAGARLPAGGDGTGGIRQVAVP